MGDMQNGDHRSEEEPTPDRVPSFSDDRLYRALAATERRRLLYLLLDGGERRIEELATVLTGWDATETGTMGTGDDRERTLVELRHVHLPLLADFGLVEYDRQRGTVDVESVDPLLEELLERSVDHRPRTRS
ncbi:MAG: DUF7344 domain-containing protein [Halobacteriota archaeon]|uniref:DUF7344 domain-containing protein n=1 Tax=Natronomonas sp. TaxID=2184060 RepID=UPI003974BD80